MNTNTNRKLKDIATFAVLFTLDMTLNLIALVFVVAVVKFVWVSL